MEKYFHLAAWKMNGLQSPMYGLLLFLVSGCSHQYYAPTVQNINGFKYKGEMRLTAGGSYELEAVLPIDADIWGAEGQAAYAISNHVALSAQGSYLWSNRDLDIQSNGHLIEAGLTYFAYKNFLYGDISGGGGIGALTSLSQRETIDLKFSDAYVQPVIGIVTPYLEVFLSAKINRVHYYQIMGNQLYQDTQEDIERMTERPVFYYIEPAGTFRVGMKKIKLQVQLLFSESLNNRWINDHYNEMRASVSVTFLLFRKDDAE